MFGVIKCWLKKCHFVSICFLRNYRKYNILGILLLTYTTNWVKQVSCHVVEKLNRWSPEGDAVSMVGVSRNGKF